MAFGLRNVTDKQKALNSMYRVLKPGGKLMVLEFSEPVMPGLKPIYDWYSFNILPKLGQLVAKALKNVDNETVKSEVKKTVKELTDKYPLYPGLKYD